jgi:acyl carrier protein
MCADKRPQLTRLEAVTPFVIAAVSGALLVLVWSFRPFGDFDSWMIGILGTILIFDLPVCVLILIGRPPVMSLSPLLPSAEERKFRKAVRERPRLSDDEFYERFYEEAGIPEHIPIRLRKIYAAELGMDGVWPEDKATDFNGELDFADLLDAVADEFGVQFADQEIGQLDGSFDSIVRNVAGKLGQGR